MSREVKIRAILLVLLLVLLSVLSLSSYKNFKKKEKEIKKEYTEITNNVISLNEFKTARAFLKHMEKRPEHVRKFTARWLHVAYNESQRSIEQGYYIPVSVNMAQGAFESYWGKSKLSKKFNNFFGVKLTSSTKGWSLSEQAKFRDDCGDMKCSFVHYVSAWASWNHHTIVLGKERYRKCWNSSNYKQYFHNLQKCGYATSKKYARKGISIVRSNRFHALDDMNPYTIVWICNVLRKEFAYPKVQFFPKENRIKIWYDHEVPM